jgi:hypothetical protein
LSLNPLEIQRLSSYFETVLAPAHILLLYETSPELEALKPKIRAKKYAELTVFSRPSKNDPKLEAKASSFIRHVGDEELSKPERLVRTERRIQEIHPSTRIVCAYNTEKMIGLGEELCVEIFSLHDYILFTRFTNGGINLLESMERTLTEALGQHGAEMVHRYMEREGIERGSTPLHFRQFLDAMHELLGGGAEPLARLIHRRLFQTLRSSPGEIKDEKDGKDSYRDTRTR